MDFGNGVKYEFDWDESKARTNLAKHKVSFDEGKTIFTDPFLITIPDDEHSEKETASSALACQQRKEYCWLFTLKSRWQCSQS